MKEKCNQLEWIAAGGSLIASIGGVGLIIKGIDPAVQEAGGSMEYIIGALALTAVSGICLKIAYREKPEDKKNNDYGVKK